MKDGNLSSWRTPGKSWFFGIGINEYQQFPDLSNAVKDVKDICQILISTYDINEECVVTLFDADATEEKIMEKFDSLGSSVKEEDKLIIYYSGHGHLNKSMNIGYWIPSDAKLNKTARYIHNSTIREYIRAIKSKHTLLISDSCFSGSLFVNGTFRSTRAIDELEDITSRWAMCSGRHDEEVYDGDPGTNSPFAKSIMGVLSNNRADSLNVAKLADRVIEVTAANYEQLPDGRPMNGVGHGGGQYIFRKRKAKDASASGGVLEVSEPTYRSYDKNKFDSDRPETSKGKLSLKQFISAILIICGTVFGIFYFISNKIDIIPNDKFVYDAEDNEYLIIETDDLHWLGDNLNVKTDRSWFFSNQTNLAKSNKWGRLYAYEDAKAACVGLGVGWRLPTIGDWKYLAEFYGSELLLSNSGSQQASTNSHLGGILNTGGDSGMDLKFGGHYGMKSERFVQNENNTLTGAYWLENQYRLEFSLFAQSDHYAVLIYPDPPSWNRAYSCRCVKSK